MLTGWQVALHKGENEAFAEIGDLANGTAVRRPLIRADARLTCLLLPMHEAVQVNGISAE